MPSVPIDIPSEIVGVPNIWGLALDSRIAMMAASTNGCKPLLQGVIVECALATPIIGLEKSDSL